MKVRVPLHALTTVPCGKNPMFCWIGGWVDPRAILDTGEEKNIF